MSKGKRQIWIEFGGDPSNDKEVYKRYSATVPFEPSSYAEEVVHTIEFKAYEELQKENENLKRIIANELNENDELGSEFVYVNVLKAENERLRAALSDIASDTADLCKMNSENEAARAECERLEYRNKQAYEYLKEAKRTFMSHVTESPVDDWIKDYEEALAKGEVGE